MQPNPLQPQTLRERFGQLRAEDARQAPVFARVSHRPAVRAAPPARWGRRGALAAVVVVLAAGAGTAWLLRQPAPPPAVRAQAFRWGAAAESPDLPWQSHVLFSQWAAPTDSLLGKAAAPAAPQRLN